MTHEYTYECLSDKCQMVFSIKGGDSPWSPGALTCPLCNGSVKRHCKVIPADQLLRQYESAREVERAALESLKNLGAPQDMWVLEYGQVLKNGEITEAGLAFFDKKTEK